MHGIDTIRDNRFITTLLTIGFSVITYIITQQVKVMQEKSK